MITMEMNNVSNILVKDNNISLTDGSEIKCKAAEFIENSLRKCVSDFANEFGHTINGVDIMFKNGQIFVGMNSVTFE